MYNVSSAFLVVVVGKSFSMLHSLLGLHLYVYDKDLTLCACVCVCVCVCVSVCDQLVEHRVCLISIKQLPQPALFKLSGLSFHH